MKAIIALLFAIISIYATKLPAQTPFAAVDTPLFYKHVEKMRRDFYQQYYTTADSGIRAEKMFNRWLNFWTPRVDLSVSTIDSMFASSLMLYDRELAKSTNGCLGNPEYAGNWSYFGPDKDNFNALHDTVGRVNAVWVKPTDANYILAGASAGGIWKTIDGGKNWVNITDNSSADYDLPGTLGITDIAVSPSNNNFIYAATGTHKSNAGNWTGKYTLGIIRSTNGGATWSIDMEHRDKLGTLSSLGWQGQDNPLNKLAYSPQNRLFALHSNRILMKASEASPWVDITPSFFTSDTSISNNYAFHDLEFFNTAKNASKLVVSTNTKHWVPATEWNRWKYCTARHPPFTVQTCSAGSSILRPGLRCFRKSRDDWRCTPGKRCAIAVLMVNLPVTQTSAWVRANLAPLRPSALAASGT